MDLKNSILNSCIESQNLSQHQVPQDSQELHFSIDKNMKKITFDQIMNLKIKQTLYNGTQVFKNKQVNDWALKQLKIVYDENNSKDKKQLMYILNELLKYPSTELAILHRQSNRLGIRDFKGLNELDQKMYNKQHLEDSKIVKKIKQYFIEKQKYQFMQNYKNQKVQCLCCNRQKQQKTLSIFTDLQYVKDIGISIYLFFFTIKSLIFMLLIMFFSYSGINIIQNIVSSQQYQYKLGSQSLDQRALTFKGILALSQGSKIENNTEFNRLTLVLQCFLGVITVFIWGLYFIKVKTQQKYYQQKIKFAEITPSDYTLLLSNVPTSVFLNQKNTQRLKKQLIKYAQNQVKLYPEFANWIPLKIETITSACPVDLQGFSIKQSKNVGQNVIVIQQKQQKYKQQLIKLINHRRQNKEYNQQYNENNRLDRYSRFSTVAQILDGKLESTFFVKIIDKFFIQFEKALQIPTVSLFVTFQNKFNKELIQMFHSKQSWPIFNLPFCKKRNYFQFLKDQKKYEIAIQPAPEPEKVKWENYYLPKYKRVIVIIQTFACTVLILSSTFFIIYFLSDWQYKYLQKHAINSKSLIGILLQFTISGVLFLYNLVIPMIIRKLTKIERHTSYTRQQISIGYKSIMALIANSILIPIVVNIVFKNNIYGVDGLADSVFFQSLTNSLMTPVSRIVINYVTSYGKFKFYTRPAKKLHLDQKALNQIIELKEFQVGQQYTSVVFMFIFACFYAPLQPIVVPITVVGLIVMYSSEKYILFKQCKRPIKGNNQINTAIHFIIFMGPMAFSVGSFLWIQKSSNLLTNFLNIVSLFFSIIILVLPYEKIVKKISQPKLIREQKYYQDSNNFKITYKQANPLQKILQQKRYASIINNILSVINFRYFIYDYDSDSETE